MLTKTPHFAHFAILFFFLLLSVFLTLGRVGTTFDSFALVNPDLGVYASIAAAQDHPALFARDPFLSNEKNINSYNMVHVPLLKVLNKVFGNYGTACAFLIPFLIFLHLTGYYLLGISIFKDPWIGLLVSLVISAPTVTFYDFWGLILDALPRFLYQSLIPFVLILSMRYGKDPKWWPVILGGVGTLNYIHPLSTPPWAAAVALGLWIGVPKLSVSQKAGRMTLAVLVLLLILFPFTMNYVKSTVMETSAAIGYDQSLAILKAHIFTMTGGGFLSPLTAFFARAGNNSFDVIWYLTWVIGLLGILFGLSQGRDSEENIHLRQIAAWMGGVFLISGFLPMVERVLFAYLRQIPPEFEILRTLRYLVPLILIATICTLQLMTHYLQQQGIVARATSRNLFLGATLAFLILWGIASGFQRHDIYDALRQNVVCWSHGHLVCDLPAISMDFIDMMDVVRDETPVGARVLSERQDVAIRYYALRPLVFTYKDGAPLAYTDQEQLLLWSKIYEEMDRLTYLRKFPFRRRAFVRGITELAETMDADYLLLEESYSHNLYYPGQLKLVYANKHYSLFKIESK